MIFDCWSINGGVRLHYLDNGSRAEEGLPIVFVPGLRGSAEDFQQTLEALAPRRALAISLRGRGLSDIPEAGYTFQDHVDDITAVVEQAGITRFTLFGHSIGVTYALGYTLQNPEQVERLILAGYPAQHPAISADWVMRVMMRQAHEMPIYAALGVQHDSATISFWERLVEITCPILVMRGGKETSKLKADAAQKYLEYAPQAELVTFEESGHRLWVPNFDRFIVTLTGFMNRVVHQE
jgi:pimeloyl-ACP methyl ester carboxylesterase